MNLFRALLIAVPAGLAMWAFLIGLAFADHYNDPNDGAFSFTPEQCFKGTDIRSSVEVTRKDVKRAKKNGATLTRTVPCDRDYFNKMWYKNIDGIMVFNNLYCAGQGRIGTKAECWLSTKNSDRGYYEVAGDAIACWD